MKASKLDRWTLNVLKGLNMAQLCHFNGALGQHIQYRMPFPLPDYMEKPSPQNLDPQAYWEFQRARAVIAEVIAEATTGAGEE